MSPSINALPFFHNSKAGAVHAILSAKQLTPQHCQVFNMNLVYFFYGRSLYQPYSRAKAAKKPMTVEERLPIAIKFKFEIIEPVFHRLNCSDSGFLKRNESRLAPFGLTDIEIGSTGKDLLRFVESVWENNYRYLMSPHKIIDQAAPRDAIDGLRFQYLRERALELLDKYENGVQGQT